MLHVIRDKTFKQTGCRALIFLVFCTTTYVLRNVIYVVCSLKFKYQNYVVDYVRTVPPKTRCARSMSWYGEISSRE